jgi:hypothetical protein
MAEVGADRLDDGLALVAEQLSQTVEPLLALPGDGHRVCRKGLTLHVENSFEITLWGRGIVWQGQAYGFDRHRCSSFLKL